MPFIKLTFLTRANIAVFLLISTTIFSVLIGTYPVEDTLDRYQIAKAAWSNEPNFREEDIITKRIIVEPNGTYNYWWGMGQSILMVPSDILAKGVVSLFISPDQPNRREYIRQELTMVFTFPIISGLTVSIAFLFLLELDFSLYVAFLGALLLFFGTTFIVYTNDIRENTQILCFTLVGYYLHFRWYKYKHFLSLITGAGAINFLLLVRFTTTADIFAESLFVLALLIFSNKKLRLPKRELFQFLAIQGFAFLLFFGLDRLYQFRRFGSWTSNYFSEFINAIKSGVIAVSPFVEGDPTAKGWPYNEPPLQGIAGVLFSPAKSIFVYDPLLIVLIVIVLARRFRLETTASQLSRSFFLVSGAVSLTIYLMGYSTIYWWGGDFAWGARYHTSPVELLCLLAAPLFFEATNKLKLSVAKLTRVLIMWAVTVQLLALAFFNFLELFELTCNEGSNFRLFQRIANLYIYATGQEDKYYGTCPSAIQQFNLTPFRTVDEFFTTSTLSYNIALFLWSILFVGCSWFYFYLIRQVRKQARENGTANLGTEANVLNIG